MPEVNVAHVWDGCLEAGWLSRRLGAGAGCPSSGPLSPAAVSVMLKSVFPTASLTCVLSIFFDQSNVKNSILV